jgi:lysyl-tRNA synthetase class 2
MLIARSEGAARDAAIGIAQQGGRAHGIAADASTSAGIDAICAAALGSQGLDQLTCRDAFSAHAGVDPLTASVAELEAAVVRCGVVSPAVETTAADRWDRAFELLLAEVVQPRLGRGRPAMLVDWPASQAAFAKIDPQSPPVARRFELFVEGVELANGWEEDPRREVCIHVHR